MFSIDKKRRAAQLRRKRAGQIKKRSTNTVTVNKSNNNLTKNSTVNSRSKIKKSNQNNKPVRNPRNNIRKMTAKSTIRRNKQSEKSINIYQMKYIFPVLQILASLAFFSTAYMSNMVPDNYVVMLLFIVIALFAFPALLVRSKLKSVKIFSAFLAVLISAVYVVGAIYIGVATRAIGDISNAEYKINNMVVVAREEFNAESLTDVADYSFGVQTASDTENTHLMIEEINTNLNKEVKTIEYADIFELANALLSSEISVAVYNEAFLSIIDETIEDFSSKIKIVHRYGVKVELSTESETPSESSEIPTTYNIEPFTMYISGIDVSGSISTNSRSDVNILMSVNPETNKILLVSIPRDYYVVLPEVSYGTKDKLTHAGIYGVDVSVAALEELLAIDIDCHTRVNFSSLVTIVDAVGGIEVNSDYNFTTKDGSHTFVQGINYMDGEAALSFSRERSAFVNGDFQRGVHQQLVIEAILDKAMSPAIITGINGIIASVSENVETSMTQDEITELVKMQLDLSPAWEFENISLEGTPDWGACYSLGGAEASVVMPDYDSVNETTAIINEFLNER